MNQHFQGL